MSETRTIWKVSTEGDDEGRSFEQLGLYQGPLDRVILGLSPKARYTMTVEMPIIIQATTLPVNPHKVAVYFRDFDGIEHLKGSDVAVTKKGNANYPIYVISPGSGYADLIREGMIDAAEAKLSKEELALLIDRYGGNYPK